MSTNPPSRNDGMQKFLPASPLPKHLGLRLKTLKLDYAELTMAWDQRLTTYDDIVHGGAIATLIDTAAMAVTWSDDTIPETIKGSTATLNVSYLAAARGADLLATATTVRRGRSLCFSEVSVTEPNGRLVARGSVLQTYA